MTSTFGAAMFARVDGGRPGYMALAPHILESRHISRPSILGNDLITPSASCSGWSSSAEALTRMDGSFPEYMAETPSTSR
jgi:hypothetical protein